MTELRTYFSAFSKIQAIVSEASKAVVDATAEKVG